MDRLWLEWGAPLLYLLLNIACILVLLRLCAWLAVAGLRRWSGVDVSCKGVWLGSIREIRIKWRGGEVGLCGLRLGLRCFSRSARRLLKVDVDQIYCVGFPEGDLTPTLGGWGHGRGASGRVSFVRRAATAVVLQLSKRLATCTDVVVGSVLLDVPCPWVGLKACAVGVSLKECRITGAGLPRGEGLHLAAQVDKGLARVASEDSEPSTAGRDLLSVEFAGELMLHLDLKSSRPVRLLQLGVVPAGVYLVEDCFEAIRESRGGRAHQPSLDYGHVIGKLSALLPLKTEAMLEEGTLQYLRHDNKKLAIKFSRFLFSATPCSHCDGVAMETHIHNLRLFTSSSDPVSSISLLHHSAELRAEGVTQCCSVTSLRGVLRDGGVVHWVKHFAALVPSSAPKGHTHPPDGGSQMQHQDPSVNKGGSVALAITLEASDWQLECYLDQQPPPSAICQLLVASVVGSVQSDRDNGRQMLRSSVRMEDVYLSTARAGRRVGQQGGGLASVLPSSSRHVWGRMVAMGTCFVEARTSYPRECPDGSIRGYPLAPLAVECDVNCGIVEWSQDTCRVVSAAVRHFEGRYGLTVPQKSGQGGGWGLLEAARRGGFQLRVANLNCIVSDKCSEERTLLLVHVDVLRAANQPGGKEVGSGEWWECEALQAGQASLSGLAVCAEVFDGQEEVFPCLLMSDLPPGVLEAPQFTVELERRDTVNVVTHISDCAVNWTPTLHCTAKHMLDAVVDSVQGVLISKPSVAAPLSDSSHAPSINGPSPLPLPHYLSKLSNVCVSVVMTKAIVNVTVNAVHKVSCVVLSGALSLSSQRCAVSAKQVEAVFDKNRIVFISEFSGRLLDDDDPLTWSRSDFVQLSLPSNTSIELVACQVEVTFPHDYFFAETFEKLQAARKFLLDLHSKGEGEKSALGVLVPLDVYLRADSFSFQLQDNRFEASLKSNHMLLTDVWSQRMEFVKALESKISQIEQEQGKISAKKKQALYESLEAQVYCDKAKAYYSDEAPSQKLFEVFIQRPRLALLADPSMLGRSSLVRQMQDIDSQTPFPADINFSTLWGCYMKGEASQFQLLFRDYPQPLLSQSDVSMRGRSILAEEEAIERATRNILIRVDPPWASVSVVKKLAALKLYHDWDWNCKVSIGCWGSCYEPVLAQVNLAFEKVVKRSVDPSKPLPFWDKMRAILHGPFKMTAEHAQLLLLSTRDPYNLTEYLDCQSTHLSVQYDTGLLELSGALDVFIHTASKYDESQLLHVPRAVFRANLKWVCPDNPNAHHSVMPCAPDKVPALEDNQVHDSFARFRSQCLSLQLSLDVGPRGEEDTPPTLVLYASTLRWLQQFQSVLFRVTSLPIRRGTVHANVRPKQQRFSRHLRDVDIAVTCAKGEVCYWGSASQQSGVHGSFNQAEASFSYSLALVPFEDGLVRRPQADWHITSCQGAGEGMEVKLYHPEEGRRGKGADFLHHLRLDDTAKQHLLSMGRVQYTRLNEQQDPLSPELRVPVEYRHQLQTLDTRVSWTSLSRTVLSGLYDAYRQSQAMKNNLLSDALKPAKHIGLSPKKVGTVSESSPPRTSDSDSPGSRHDDGHDHRHRSPSTTNLLTQLISDVTRRVVEHTDESGRSTEPRLKGKEACSQEDVEQQNWLIQLENTQLAFQGVESRGCVLVSATLAHATNHTHNPKLSNSGDILVKTSWVARVEDMQYFATVDPEVCVSANNMPWISASKVMGQPIKVAMATDPTQPREADDINALLLGTLGPQEMSTNVRDPLVGGMSSASESVGGLVASTAQLENGEPIQLQRIASRCYCQIFYVTYSQEEESSGRAAHKVSPVKENQPCVDTFTIRHPSVHISTTSSQYAMLLDIVNNLLLYKEPRQKELTETMKRLRFTLQLSNIEDCRTPILARQERVRQLLENIRTLEREISMAVKATDNLAEAVDELHDRLSDLKAQLHQVGQELDVLIKLYKENQFFLPPSVAPSQSKKPHPVRCIEVWLDDAHWWLTEDDGQIELADVTLANCCYVRNSFSDDSGEHRFELQDCSVQNLSPTAAYQEVLVPYDRDWRVDKNVRLRVYCRDKAPVAGISVKDHFEVNVVPLKVQLTQQFYGRMFEFFFPSRAVHEEGPQDSEMAHLIVGTQPPSSGDGQHEVVGEGSGDRSKRKKGAADSQRRKGATMELSDVERMRERALQIKTFLYIKITPVPLLISYHGKQGGIPIDIDNFKVSIPTLEYHSHNWTWKDLFMAIKRDCKQAIVPKAIKTKLGMESRSEHRQGLVLGREAAGPLDMQLLWSGSQRASKRSKSKVSKEAELK